MVSSCSRVDSERGVTHCVLFLLQGQPQSTEAREGERQKQSEVLVLKHFVVHCSPVYYKLVQNKVMVMKLCHLFCYADLDHVST